MNYLSLIIMVLIAYLIGNISPATLIGRFYGIDIKKEGSGNAGTTNVLRTLGPKAAAGTLIIDVCKGYVAVVIAQGSFHNQGAMLAFAAVVIGHIYPIVFRFKGGKGVATFFGAAMAINWPSAFAAAIIAVAAAAASKKMSIGSIAAALFYPLLILYYYPKSLPVAVFMTFVIIFTHRTNIKRLMRGEEKELSIGSKLRQKLSEQDKNDSVDGGSENGAEGNSCTQLTSSALRAASFEETEEDEDKKMSSDLSEHDDIGEKNAGQSYKSVEISYGLDDGYYKSTVGVTNMEDLSLALDFTEEESCDELVSEAASISHTKVEVLDSAIDYYKDIETPKLDENDIKNVAIIGNGSFGTAIANVIAHNGHRVTIYGRNKEAVNKIRESRINEKYLPGARLHDSIRFTSNLRTAVSKRDIVIFAVPAQQFGKIVENASRFIGKKCIVVNLAKGIENESLKTMSQIAEKYMKNKYVAVSGPSHAEEIVRNYPTTVVAASGDERAAEEVQNVMMSSKFRVYTSDDILGVELGGALKNVIAIGTGIADGMKFGDNSRAALMTRGIHEISRLGQAMGAKSETFAGLSGIGDLMVTCSSDLSRNRRCGILIGAGLSPEEAIREIKTTVEGFYTVTAADKLANRMGIEMPITSAVKNVIDGKLDSKDAVELLMKREKKQENK